MPTAWLIFVLLSLQPHTASMFVSENASRDQFQFADGVLDIRGGRGWLRTPRIYSDFRLSLEFRPMTPDAEMAIVLRTLTSRDEIFEPAYRITVPPVRDAPAAILRAPKDASRLVKQGSVQLISGEGAWQRLEIVAQLGDVTIALNDTLVSEYQVDTLAGYILFTSRRGHVQMRNINAGDIEPTFTTPADMRTPGEVRATGGTAPRLRKEVRPFYSIEAMHQRKVAGVVWLEAVVLPDGTVGSVRVTKPLDQDLDRSAIAAVRKWLFTPATVNGLAIPALVEVEMSFAIGR